MLRLLEGLPVELVGTNVLGYLTLKDTVMLERACGSKKSHQAFKEQIPLCTPFDIPSDENFNLLTLNWFAKKQCKIHSLTLSIPYGYPGLQLKKLHVDYFDLHINSSITMECSKILLESNKGFKVRSLTVDGNQKREVMEQLSACTGNVKQLTINYSNNCLDWLTADSLS